MRVESGLSNPVYLQNYSGYYYQVDTGTPVVVVNQTLVEYQFKWWVSSAETLSWSDLITLCFELFRRHLFHMDGKNRFNFKKRFFACPQ